MGLWRLGGQVEELSSDGEGRKSCLRSKVRDCGTKPMQWFLWGWGCIVSSCPMRDDGDAAGLLVMLAEREVAFPLAVDLR